MSCGKKEEFTSKQDHTFTSTKVNKDQRFKTDHRMSDTDKQEIQSIADQVARQFATMREQQQQRDRASASSSRSVPGPVAGSDRSPTEVSVTGLAKQLEALLVQGTPATEVQGNVAAVDPFASVPDPSIYERDFVNVFERVNRSVLAFEDPQLLVKETTQENGNQNDW